MELPLSLSLLLPHHDQLLSHIRGYGIKLFHCNCLLLMVHHALLLRENTLVIFLWLPYVDIFTTGPPVFVNSPFRLGKVTNCSIETVSHHFSFL